MARKSSPNMEIEAELSDVVDLTPVTVHEAKLPLQKQRGGASHMGIDKAFDNLKRIRVSEGQKAVCTGTAEELIDIPAERWPGQKLLILMMTIAS